MSEKYQEQLARINSGLKPADWVFESDASEAHMLREAYAMREMPSIEGEIDLSEVEDNN